MDNPRFSTGRFSREVPTSESLIPKREGTEVTSFKGLQDVIRNAILGLRAGPGMNAQNADMFQQELDALIRNPNTTVVDYTKLQSRIQTSSAWDAGSEKK